MDKECFVKNLSNVKLVLGNGFDLHCGLFTSYKDFYLYNYHDYKLINDSYKAYVTNGLLNLREDFYTKYTVWDILFALSKDLDLKNNKIKWCDIEEVILSSLLNKKEFEKPINIATSLKSMFKWTYIMDYSPGFYPHIHDERKFVWDFIKKKNAIDQAKNNFYRFLLNELIEFEKRFGLFVFKQLANEQVISKIPWINETYINNAKNTIIGNFSRFAFLSSIESFNYTFIDDELIKNKYVHINGSYENPIFGIDTIFEPTDARFIFTKTSRRMESDLCSNTCDLSKTFSNVIVYGHSLNKADYSYFFPILDKLKLNDVFSDGIIVFAFDIYDKENEENIRTAYRESVANLIYEYAKSKNIPDKNRFLDTLSTQKRVIFYEIKQIPDSQKYDPKLKADWDQLKLEVSKESGLKIE